MLQLALGAIVAAWLLTCCASSSQSGGAPVAHADQTATLRISGASLLRVDGSPVSRPGRTMKLPAGRHTLRVKWVQATNPKLHSVVITSTHGGYSVGHNLTAFEKDLTLNAVSGRTYKFVWVEVADSQADPGTQTFTTRANQSFFTGPTTGDTFYSLFWPNRTGTNVYGKPIVEGRHRLEIQDVTLNNR